MIRILFLILLCIVINANSVECYDGNKWRKIPKEVLYNNGIDPFNLRYKEDCKAAYRIYKKISRLSSNNNNKTKTLKNNTDNKRQPSTVTYIAEASTDENQQYVKYILLVLIVGVLTYFIIKRLRRKRYYDKLLREHKKFLDELRTLSKQEDLKQNHQKDKEDDFKILSEQKFLEENRQDDKEDSSYDDLTSTQKKYFIREHESFCEKRHYSSSEPLELNYLEEDHQELSYDDLLKSPMWKSFRKYILRKRGNICERCHDPYSKPLNIHHRYYLYDDNGKYMPWEYSYKAMLVLCKNCHDTVHRTIRIHSYYRPR